jgi:hypothetical protein
MPAFLKYLLLGVIGLICLGIGFLGSTAYFGARGTLEGFAYSCKILDVAEKKGILTKQQRASVAADTAKGGGSDQLTAYLSSDCAKTPFQAMTDLKK